VSHFFEAIFDQTYQFIGILTPDGTNRKINQTTLDFTGFKEEALIGKKLWDVPFWAHSKQLQEKVKRPLNGPQTSNFTRMEVDSFSAYREKDA
jgi:PAS domain S-box-containing protein